MQPDASRQRSVGTPVVGRTSPQSEWVEMSASELEGASGGGSGKGQVSLGMIFWGGGRIGEIGSRRRSAKSAGGGVASVAGGIWPSGWTEN